MTADSTLNIAADWAAIAAAVFAFVLLVAGAARWLWSRWNSAKLNHALHTERAPVGTDRRDEGFVGLRVGLTVANGSVIPISHQVVTFDVRVGDWDNPLTEMVDREVVAPGQKRDWYRGRMSIAAGNLPADVTVTYDIRYGRRARKPTRRLTGGFMFHMSDARDATSFVESLQPERDERLPKRFLPWRD